MKQCRQTNLLPNKNLLRQHQEPKPNQKKKKKTGKKPTNSVQFIGML